MNRSSLLKSSAILSATTLAANAAHAAVVYSGPVNLTVTGETPVFFDLDGDAAPDYKFLFSNNNQNKPTMASADYNTGVGTNRTFAANSDRGLSVTPAGTTIDASFLGGLSQAYSETFFYQNVDDQAVVGSWTDGGGEPVTGYIGFAMPREGGDFNFGWAQMVVDVDGKTLTLVDFAYETDPNVGLVTAAVPEVESTSLIVAGALTLLLLRRRKQQPSE